MLSVTRDAGKLSFDTFIKYMNIDILRGYADSAIHTYNTDADISIITSCIRDEDDIYEFTLFLAYKVPRDTAIDYISKLGVYRFENNDDVKKVFSYKFNIQEYRKMFSFTTRSIYRQFMYALRTYCESENNMYSKYELKTPEFVSKVYNIIDPNYIQKARFDYINNIPAIFSINHGTDHVLILKNSDPLDAYFDSVHIFIISSALICDDIDVILRYIKNDNGKYSVMHTNTDALDEISEYHHVMPKIHDMADDVYFNDIIMSHIIDANI